MKNYIQLMRLDKPVGIYLLLFPTLSALLVAHIDKSINYFIFFIFILGSILTRSLGCVINDYFDSDFDKYVERTKNRPLAKDSSLKNKALILCFILAILSFILVLFLNTKTILLSILAFVSALTYPLFKRFFATPQAYLGIAFSMGIPMAFTSINTPITWIAYCLIIANISLVFAYDTIYALVDKEDDIKINIKTSALFLGKYDILAISISYAIFWLLNIIVFIYFKANILVYILCILGIIQTIYFLVKIQNRDRKNCFKVFKDNQYIVFIQFICMLFLYLNL